MLIGSRTGVYGIYWKITPSPGKYQPISFGGKSLKWGKKKEENVKVKEKRQKTKGKLKFIR
jgi:hypothetical protein